MLIISRTRCQELAIAHSEDLNYFSLPLAGCHDLHRSIEAKPRDASSRRTGSQDTSESKLWSPASIDSPGPILSICNSAQVVHPLRFVRCFSSQDSYERAKALLKARSKEHKNLAEALLRYETLDAKEIQMVLEGKTLGGR